MSKAIIVVDIPEDCETLKVNVEADADQAIELHELYYDDSEIILRRRAYNLLHDQLIKLGIT